MRYCNYLVAATVAGLATAAFTGGAAAQAAKPTADEIRAAAAAAGITNPDAIRQLIKPSAGLAGLDQWGCGATEKVYGEEHFPFEGFRYGGCLPRGTENNPDGFRVLIKAAQATGQFRNNAYGFANGPNQWLVIGDTSANSRFEGNGTWMGQDVAVRMEWDYRIPAARFYVTHDDGSQDIWVTTDPRKPAAGRTGHLEQPELYGDGALDGYQQVNWKEEPAGVYAGPSDMTSEQLLAMAYLLPSGVILAGRDAANVLKVSKDDQARDVMTIPVPALGGADLIATLDASGRPVHTEVTVGGKKYSGDFGNFLNDRMDNEQHFPFDITLQVDGQTIADWELDYFHSGPYVVFPVPAEVAAK